MSIFAVILALLAVWRIARLISVDTIGERLRVFGASRSEWLSYLLTCPWCISIWIAPPVLVIPVYFPTNRPLFVLVAALAGSLVAGLGQTIEDRLDR